MGMDLGERADKLFSAYSGAVPGAAFAVASRGKILFKRSYGSANLASGTYVGDNTNFRLASVTKAFTAICVLKLVEAGRLSLDDRLSKFISGLPGYADEITIRQMLGHTSGLGDYEGDVPENYPGQVHEDYVVQKVKCLQSTYFPPGSWFQYSDTAYVLLAVIVENVSGYSFPKFIENEIFKPLGMTGSRLYGGEGALIRDRAYGYTRSGGGFRLNDQSKTSATLGDGCIYSSLEDMFSWDRGLTDGKLVNDDLIKEAFSPGRLNDGSTTAYGYGWFIIENDGVKILHHAGETAGFMHKFIRVPQLGLAMIILTNRDSWDLSLKRSATEGEDSVNLLEYFDLI